MAPGDSGGLTINRDLDRVLSRARAKIHWGGGGGEGVAKAPATGQTRHTPEAQVETRGPDALLLGAQGVNRNLSPAVTGHSAHGHIQGEADVCILQSRRTEKQNI